MLQKRLPRIGACLCAAALLFSMTAALAASPQPETVHASLWKGNYISIDGVPICFTDQQGVRAIPFTYEGTVYIPLQTASEWLGCDAVWDEQARTVTLTSGQEVYYRDKWLDQPTDSSKEAGDLWRQQYAHDYQYGLDVELRPDVTVFLDGEAKTFTTVNGTPIYPALLRGEIYLPVRGVGELLGKEVHWQAERLNADGLELWKVEVEDLYAPMPQLSQPCLIQLYDTPTAQQLDEVQAYIDQAQALYDKALAAAEDFRACDSMTREEAISRLETIAGYADALRALPEPGGGFFQYQHESLTATVWALSVFDIATLLNVLQYPELRTMEEFLAYDSLGSNPFVESMFCWRGAIIQAQERLDEMRAQLLKGQ